MVKTSIYLEPEVDRALARLAAQRGVSKAEVIRESLRETARAGQRPKPRAIGVIQGPGDMAANTDDYLSRWGFGGWPPSS